MAGLDGDRIRVNTFGTGASMKPRAVLIPGLMGTALQDATRPRSEIKDLCARHWEIYPRLKRWLEDRGNELCNDDSDVIWGKLQFVHWLADVKGWLALLTRGDGYTTPGGIQPKGLTELELRTTKRGKPHEYKPYAALVERLGKEHVDLLPFAFDWRLRANDAAARLGAAILQKWWPKGLPSRPLYQSEKVVLIGHSLGGIVARLFVEDPIYAGHRMVRRVVLIGTPNKGAPVAFAYFTGAKSFFNDSPFWKELRRFHDEQPRVSEPSATLATESGATTPPAPNPNYAVWSPREISPSIILESEQVELVQSLASICQLVPSYDFVELGKDKKQKFEETYKYEVHRKTNKKLLEILEEVSKPLRDPRNLDAWLDRHDINYDIIGSTKLPTPTALKPHKTKGWKYVMVVTKKAGDGTVPTFSAIDWARAEKRLKRIEFVEADPRNPHAVHPQLCQHKQVIEHVVAHTTRLPKSLIASTDNSNRMGRGRIEQYMQVAYDIFRSGRSPFKNPVPDSRSQVIAFALIEGKGPKPLINPDTERDINGVERLKENVPGIDRTRIVYKGSSGAISYRFVLLPPHGESTFGSGVLFLPDEDKTETWLHLFGIITRRWDSRSCDNDGHAEMQLARWLEAQRQNRSWHDKVFRLDVWNENLLLAKRKPPGREDNLGFSPCAYCCVDLANIWWPATNDPKNTPQKVLYWNTLYPGKEGCDNRTTLYSLGRMEAAGWQFANSPLPAAAATPPAMIEKRPPRGMPITV
jgi:hypothetical protein